MDNLPPLPNALVPKGTADLSQVSLDKLRWLLSHPTWNFMQQGFDYSRSYAAGLSTMGLLLHLVDYYAHRLGPHECDQARRMIYGAALHFLDKLDRWGDYLALWDRLRATTAWYSRYDPEVLTRHPNKTAAFVLGYEGSSVKLHWLYGVHRRDVIRRKQARAAKGAPTKSDFHAPQSELSPGEIEERISWFLKFRGSGQYDFDPPAHRQRERRRKPQGPT